MAARKTAKQSCESRTLAYFKNGIGNWVLMTPALQALASMDSSGKIVVVTDSAWTDSRSAALADLWAATQWIERVIRHPKETYAGKPDRVFYSKHSEGGDAFTWFQSFDPNFGNQIDWRGTLVNEHDYYMELVLRLGYKGATPAQFIPVVRPSCFVHGDVVRDMIVLCNGAFGKMQTQKHWPHFAELAEVLRRVERADADPLEIVGIGAGNELRGVALDKDFVGKLTMPESAFVVQHATLVITTDTAIMHVADAMRVPTVALFGGTIVSKNGPVNGRTIVVRSGVQCQPCQYTDRFESCAEANCMRNLSVGEVMSHVRTLL